MHHATVALQFNFLCYIIFSTPLCWNNPSSQPILRTRSTLHPWSTKNCCAFHPGAHCILLALEYSSFFLQTCTSPVHFSVREMCVCCVSEWRFSSVLSLPLPPPPFFFELQGILLSLLQAACKLSISHFIARRIQACNRGHWCSPSF